MSRKVREDRIYKTTKWAVNIVSTILLVYALYLTLNESSFKDYIFQEYSDCNSTMTTCGYILDEIADAEKAKKYSWIIGLGLPLIFYGLPRVLDFYFPKDDKK